MVNELKKVMFDCAHLFKQQGISKIREKAPGDFVTNIDLAIEKKLREALPDIEPRADILGEEEGGGQENGSLLWVIDPLDGTANARYGIAHSSISVGLLEHGKPCFMRVSTHPPT